MLPQGASGGRRDGAGNGSVAEDLCRLGVGGGLGPAALLEGKDAFEGAVEAAEPLEV